MCIKIHFLCTKHNPQKQCVLAAGPSGAKWIWWVFWFQRIQTGWRSIGGIVLVEIWCGGREGYIGVGGCSLWALLSFLRSGLFDLNFCRLSFDVSRCFDRSSFISLDQGRCDNLRKMGWIHKSTKHLGRGRLGAIISGKSSWLTRGKHPSIYILRYSMIPISLLSIIHRRETKPIRKHHRWNIYTLPENPQVRVVQIVAGKARQELDNPQSPYFGSDIGMEVGSRMFWFCQTNHTMPVYAGTPSGARVSPFFFMYKRKGCLLNYGRSKTWNVVMMYCDCCKCIHKLFSLHDICCENSTERSVAI